MAKARKCVRCGRSPLTGGGTMPDGRLCSACYRNAIRTVDVCACCGVERLVPCVNLAAEPICVDCGGCDKSFVCARCGQEGALSAGTCERCRLGDQLDEMLAGPADLGALREAMINVARPDSVLIWLRKPHVAALLPDLASGRIELSHDGLDEFASTSTADFLRSLLVECGLLPRRDRVLARYDRWIRNNLDAIAEHPDDVRLINQYVQWNQRKRLLRYADQSELRSAQCYTATQALRVTGKFCDWLRTQGSSIESCDQALLDRWIASGNSTHRRIRGFLKWALTAGAASGIEMPREPTSTSPRLDQHERLRAIKLLLDPDVAQVHIRCMGLLLLLYAQPVSRIVTIKRDALTEEDGQLTIILGSDPSPIPEPFDKPFRELSNSRANRNTYNANSDWLFPGMRAGNHIAAARARGALKALEPRLLAARNSAMRELVTDCPPPVVADMLGYTYNATTKHAKASGSPWLSYAALRSS